MQPAAIARWRLMEAASSKSTRQHGTAGHARGPPFLGCAAYFGGLSSGKMSPAVESRQRISAARPAWCGRSWLQAPVPVPVK
jgi:hypothetical protein